MTSALYLEHYLDGLEHLPSELQRNFKLMRDLDSRAQKVMQNIDEKAHDFMQLLVNDREAVTEEMRRERLKSIQDNFNLAKEYGDDKVQLAIQTYELVDKHIRNLDSDLARFEGEIQDKTMGARSKSEEAVGKKGRKKGKDAKASAKRRSKGAGGSGAAAGGSGGAGGGASSDDEMRGLASSNATQVQSRSKKTKKSSAETEEASADQGGHETPHSGDLLTSTEMPIDPNEPTYCLCHQVSYGEMIGCDNPDCPIEWFHFACVGLTTKPKGKWFCPKCSQDRKKK